MHPIGIRTKTADIVEGVPPEAGRGPRVQKKKNPHPSETEILATASMRSTGPL